MTTLTPAEDPKAHPIQTFSVPFTQVFKAGQEEGMPTPIPGFFQALKAAADLDAFVLENIDSEYTRGIVETIINGLMDNKADADMGSDAVREYVTRLGQEVTAIEEARFKRMPQSTEHTK